jgi:cytidylate kinase
VIIWIFIKNGLIQLLNNKTYFKERRAKMSVITISRGSYSKGKEIAEKIAEKLGYDCISRDILIDASEHFNVPEIKLIRALHDAPSIFSRFHYGKEKYISYICEALLNHVQKDNVVYHGLAGHFFLQGVPHVLKVRIIADLDYRIKEEMKRENISEKEARYILKKDDDERRKWGLYLYGKDTADSSLYDIVLHIDNLKVDDAVDMLINAVKRPCFQTTSESKMIFNDLYSTASAKAMIIDEFPLADVSSKNGTVYISVKASMSQKNATSNKLNKLLEDFNDAKEMKIQVVPFVTDD